MSLSTCVLISVFVLVVSSQTPPSKPLWPDQFISTFGLNITPIILLFINTSSEEVDNASSTFYSNWQIKAQLVDYPTQCIPFNTAAANQACKIWFLPAGAYISIPAQDICCLWFPGVGAVSPDFLAAFNYSGVIENVPDMYGEMHSCYRWEGSGFLYWTERGEFEV